MWWVMCDGIGHGDVGCCVIGCVIGCGGIECVMG